jgi:hypothetical protein
VLCFAHGSARRLVARRLVLRRARAWQPVVVDVIGAPAPRGQRRARLLPVLYFGVAHLALTLACLAVVSDPRGVSGFFYHDRMLGIVHLVTLGWITALMLGALYAVAPIALHTCLPVTWLDYTAFAFVLTGIVGMVAHFWVQEYAGMAWSAIGVGTGILAVGVRVAGRLRGAPLPAAIGAHLVLAFLNVSGAAVVGVLVGFDKVYHFLPGFVLATVFAHAHLAAIGWASMMIVAMGYALLPARLAAAPPNGPGLWISAVLLETGVCGLFVTVARRGGLAGMFALLVIGGFAASGAQIILMLWRARNRRPVRRRLDPTVLHASVSVVWLVVASALGVWLTLAAPSPNTLRVATAYGVFGLVGFLAQMVVGLEGLVLPIITAECASLVGKDNGPMPPPAETPGRYGQDLVFLLWLFGVPSLAGGLAFDTVPFVRAGASCLLAAALVHGAEVGRVLCVALAPRFARQTD